MTTQIKHVLVAGPNGTLGPIIITALQRSSFPLTLLTTNASKTNTAFPSLPAVEVDYTSPSHLTSALASLTTPPSRTALIILINRDQPAPQIALLSAAASAGIAHVIPSSFGLGKPDDAYLRKFPPLEGKYEMEDHVFSLGEQGKLNYICIQTGAFLDWGLERGLFANLIDAETRFPGVEKGSTLLFDGGEARFSATLLADIGTAVVAVLKDPGKFRNEQVYVHSAVLSQNQLLRYARELAPERAFPTVDVDTAALEQAAREKFEAGEKSKAVMGMFMPRPTFGLGLGLFEDVANERVGVKVMDEEEVRALVGRYVKQ